jgi:hypothetical protein
MKINKSLVKQELGWSLYFLILSYILVGLYSSFNPLNYTIAPFHFGSLAEWDIVIYPKWLVIIWICVLFMIGKGLYLLAPFISKKSIKIPVYIASFGMYIFLIYVCVNLFYIKKEFKKKAEPNVFEYSSPVLK